jgi:sodium/proline symporter
MSYILTAYFGAVLGSYAAYTLPGLKATDEAVIRLSIKLLPPIGAGLLCSSLLAVTMSSADTYLNAPTSVIVHDLIRPFKPSLSDKQLLRIAKILTVILAVIASVIGLWLRGIITVLITFLYFTIAAIPPFIASVFWRKASAEGSFWGMLIGGIVSAGLRFANIYRLTPPGNFYGMYLPAWLGIAISTVILVVLSIVKPKTTGTEIKTVSRGNISPQIQHIIKLMPW